MKQGVRKRSTVSAENQSRELSAQVNQTNDLASGAMTKETSLNRTSRPTDYHLPLATTGPRSQLPLEPLTLSSKAPLSHSGTGDAIVLIMGPAGSGKSSFISKATCNVDEGVGHDLSEEPYTKEIRTTKCVVEGTPITLVDVPARFDGATPNVMMLSMVSTWLDKMNKSKALISAILVFYSIADNRVRWKLWDLFHRCREWCGDELVSGTRIALVTTMWDEVGEEVGNERLAELQGNHWKQMLESGSTVLRYQNTPESAMELLRAVVCQKSDQIQSVGALPPSVPGELALSQTPLTVGEQSIFVPKDAAHEVQLCELSTQDMLILCVRTDYTSTIVSLIPSFVGRQDNWSSGLWQKFGKAIGNEEGVGHVLCAGSHTREIRATKCTIGNFTSAVLLDTPGFDDMRISEKQVLGMVSKSLAKTHKDRRVFISAILFFYPITDNRLHWTPLKHLRLFQKLCGEEAMAQTGLVTTMWDEIDEDVGNERMAALQSNYWRFMITQGSKTYRFSNTGDAARELLQEVVSKGQERYNSMLRQQISELKTYKEIVAARKLCSRLEHLSKKRFEIMRELRSEEGRAVDRRTKEDLKREYADVGAELDIKLNQARVLKRSLTLPPLRRLFKAFEW
ncbi:hypothetical protein EDC04DRAFT_2894970 [Pisolithus marmoratus]|nr:hypothetical protein EDC04DRAFT_2894970 [Pisolithus marmoratus]